jgi:hypothetical protein
MKRTLPLAVVAMGALLACCVSARAQDVRIKGEAEVTKTMTVSGTAAGTNESAKKAAEQAALRKAVEQGCGVFLNSKTKTRDYKVVYDKIIADAVGYVKESKVDKVEVGADQTTVTVTAVVSTKKFEKDWSDIVHTVRQKDNPRIIMVIDEGILFATSTTPTGSADVVQGKLEDFFLSKKIKLMDREMGKKVSQRDKELAVVKDDAQELAALGARFEADVLIVGKATAKYSKTIQVKIGEQTVEQVQFVVTLRVKAIETDSARLLVSKTYGPETVTTMQMGGGADKGLAKVAEAAAPDLLDAIVEAWRQDVNVTRNIQLNISGMDYGAYKKFDEEVSKLEGVQALRMREITESVANIDVEYEFDQKRLADVLLEIKSVKLEVSEITPNRIKLKVVK